MCTFRLLPLFFACFCVWPGGSGIPLRAQETFLPGSGNWSEDGNWQDGSAPVSGNTTWLSFERGATTETTHDLGVFTLNRLDGIFTSPGTKEEINVLATGGASLVLDGTDPRIHLDGDLGELWLNLPVTLNQTLTMTSTHANTVTRFYGGLSGSGGLNVQNGAAFFEGDGLATYSGTTVVDAGGRLTASGDGTGNQLSAASAHVIDGVLGIVGGDNIIGSLAGSGNVYLIDDTGGLAVGTLDTDTEYSGNMSGSGTFEKVGAGILTLTGSVSLFGTVSSEGILISEGNLQIGNGGTTGSVVGSIVNNANLVFDRSDALTYTGRISGTGSLVQQGTGTLTLTRANTYTGGTTLSDGTLAIGHDGALGSGVLSISDGTTLATDGNPRRITNNMVVNGDFNVFPDGTLPTVSAFELDGDMDLTGGNRVITNTMNFGAFEFGQVNFGGVISNGGLTFADDGYTAGSNAVFFRLDGSESNTYTGDTVVGTNVSLTLDKSGGATAIAGDLFVGNEAVLVVNQSEQIVNGATVELSGNGRLQVGGGMDVTETIGSLNDDGSGDAEVALSDNTAGSQLVVDSGDFSGNINGGMAGGHSLVKDGPGILILRGGSDYLGGTVLDGGILRLEHDDAISSGTLHVLGSTISYADGVVIANPVNLQNNVDLEVLGGDAARQEGGIGETGGSYGITKVGEGVLRLTGTNTYTGETTIEDGTLVVRGNGSVDTTSDVVVGDGFSDEGTLRVTGSNASLSTTEELLVGNWGEGDLRVANGGTASAGSITVAERLTSGGTARVTGVGSTLTSLGDFTVGRRGDASVLVDNGGALFAQDLYIARGLLSESDLWVRDAGSLVDLSGDLQVGNVLNEGYLFVEDGASVHADGDASFGQLLSGDGFADVVGGDSLLSVGGELQVGGWGAGSLHILDGATTSVSGNAIIGESFTGEGDVLVAGDSATMDVTESLQVGQSGEGFLSILEGGTVMVGTFAGAGLAGTGFGSIYVEDGDSLLQTGDNLVIGGSGDGYLGVLNQGQVSVGGDLLVAGSGPAYGEVRVRDTGSIIQVNGLLSLGSPEGSEMRIQNGGFASASLATVGTSVGDSARLNLNGPGSTLDIRDLPLTVGFSGEGVLNLRNGALLDHGAAGPIQLGLNSDSRAVFRIGNNSGDAAPGIVNASGIQGGDGDARLIFSHNAPVYYFTNDGLFDGNPVEISGSTRVVQRDGGTLLNAANSHTGGTRILGGNLFADHTNALGDGPVQIDGGDLHALDALSIGGDLDWSDGFIFQTLGTSTTHIDVDGNLTLGAPGEFDFTAGTGFSNQTPYLIVSTNSPLPYDPGTDFIGNTLFGLAPEFNILGDDLYVNYPGAFIATGAMLQNSNPVNIPFFADFMVSGQVQTGDPSENNIIRSLTFDPGSSLQVFNILQVTDGILTVQNGAAVVSGGTLFMPGNFEKLGGGTLVLASTVNVNGSASLNGGSTLVNGQFYANGGLRVQSGALLGGNGTIIGSVQNAGTVSPGNSIDLLTIDGDYRQSETGTLLSEISSSSHADLLRITGTAQLDGRLLLRVNRSGVSYGDSVPVLTAREGIHGQFNEIAGAPDGFRVRRWMSGNGTRFNVLFAPSSYTLVAEGDNQHALASALDQWIGSTDPELFAATFELDFLRAGQYPTVFEAILPRLYGSLADGALAGATQDGRTVNGESVFALHAPRPEAVEDHNRWRLWTDLRGGYSENDVFSMDNEGGTLLLGMDTLLWQNLVAGLYFGGQEQESKDTFPSHETEGIRFGIYSSMPVAEHGYVSAVLGGGVSETDTERALPFGRRAEASIDGSDWFARLESGYRFGDTVVFTPFAGVQYSSSSFDGFREESDSVYALGLQDHNTDRTAGFAGLRLSRSIPLNEGTSRLSPYASILYRGAFSDDETSLNARLRRGEGPAFAYQVPANDVDGIEYSAGIRWHNLSNGLGLHLGYTGFAGEDRDSHLVNLGVSIGR